MNSNESQNELLLRYLDGQVTPEERLRALLANRFRRILLPCLLGLVTLVPVTMWLSAKAIQSGVQRQAQRPS